MNIKIICTDSKNEDFISLVTLLDMDLYERYGELQKQYKKHNKLDYIKDVVLIYMDEIPVACGALKERENNSLEMKRIFVEKEYRRQGLSKLVINELEKMGKLKGYSRVLLETGVKQQEAIHLYQNSGYRMIENFEPYVGNPNSICMEKDL